MEIRKTLLSDFENVLEIYACARSFMAAHGNPAQWGSTHPPQDMIMDDIVAGRSYLCVEHGIPMAVFCFQCGVDDPAYQEIDGAWRNDLPYGVVHRIASAPGTRGAATFCLNWCFEQCRNLRIDTHEKNQPMQNLLGKLGFTFCGIIQIEDGTPRLAYQKCL